MEAHVYILQFLIILVSARLLGEIAAALGAPTVIGELLAGIIIGPSLFGWVEVNDVILILAEIGVILLLFEVGLDTDFNKLMATGNQSVVVALGGFIAPMLAGYAAAYYLFDLSSIVSLFIGGALTATSIGITVRTLTDLKRNNSVEGQITLGAAVLDDVLGVILLALLYEFSVTGEVNWVNTAKVLAYVSVFFMLAPVLAKLMSNVISRLDERIDNPGLIPVTIISLVLFFAWLAHWFGAPELLGGFAAGIALSRRFFLPFGVAAVQTSEAFSHKIESQMRPIVQVFTPFFFVTVGLSLDLRTVDWGSAFFWWFSLAMLLIAIVTKFAGALLVNEPLPRRLVIGMAMTPRGEVGLIFAGLGVSANVFNNDIYTAMIMVIAYTTILSPFWIKLYYKLYGHKLATPDSPSSRLPP